MSTKAQYGFLRDRSDNLRGPGTPAANRSLASKAFYGMNKTQNKLIIFYQTPNVYNTGTYWLTNIHQYTTMQKFVLGKALFQT